MKKGWTHWRKANYKFFEREVVSERPCQLLDLGAGPRQFSKLFDKFEITAVDFGKFDGIDVMADLTKDFPFQDSSYDILIVSNTLEHIPNYQHFLNECYRVLRKGGKILGTVPFMTAVHQHPNDFHRFTYFMLKKSLTEAGFEKVKVESLSNSYEVYESAKRKFFKSGGNLFILKLHNLLDKFVAKNVSQDMDCTEGYGFVAYR